MNSEYILYTLIPALIAAFAAILGSGGVMKSWLESKDTKRKDELNDVIGEQINPVIEKIESVDKKIDNVENRLNEHVESSLSNQADHNRTKILRFADDLENGKKPNKEYFNDIMDIIDSYELYCEENDKYINSKANLSIEYIKDQYIKSKYKRGDK